MPHSRRAATAAGLVLLVALSACAGPPLLSLRPPPPPVAPTAPPLVSSHLDFQRNPGGGFSADLVVHHNGRLEVRQLGVGYANWIYRSSADIAIRMTDGAGRLLFVPVLSCRDRDRQARPPDRGEWVKRMSPGSYEVELTIDRHGESVQALLRVDGTTFTDDQVSASIGWTYSACRRQPERPQRAVAD